ncbi:MAG: aminotransferase class I/II-fold pyridoxal phosphate-dependent enzyme [Sutterellaceae bacterium]|nr:aminotransferase class I/II-fold pyridoxal phosphate-dependent enzyme [Sutterellaceae bacterium]
MTEKYQFQCDYIAGCHPAVLKALTETNLVEVPGYAEDKFCEEASQLIRKACDLPEAAVHYFAGGTQTNLTVISSVLRPHQGVVACDSGHIEAHETGAIEATGHKVLTVPAVDGKVTAENLKKLCQDYFDNEEKVLLVQPGMLYISFPTETGTIYSLQELEDLAAICKTYDLFFYIDGARLGYGLAASPDVKITDIARLADAFYIGGTKCGTLGGEALVIKNEFLKKDFAALMRRQGALLAKGRFAGVQFLALMTDDLYFRIGEKAVAMAMRLRQAFLDAGCEPAGNSPTNQQFFILTQAQAEFLSRKYRFENCGKTDDGRLTVRFCTAWSTKEEVVDELIADIAQIKGL